MLINFSDERVPHLQFDVNIQGEKNCFSIKYDFRACLTKRVQERAAGMDSSTALGIPMNKPVDLLTIKHQREVLALYASQRKPGYQVF